MNAQLKTALQATGLFFHFAIVFYGAATVHVKQRADNASTLLVNYRILTGAGEGYGFFSPDVPNQIVATAKYIDESDREITENFGFVKREAELRLNSLMYAFRKLETYDLQARCLAAYVLGHQPQANQVEITLSEFEVPSMKEFRLGERPRPQEFYRGTFARDEQLEQLEK
jgi:hypothetical protein